MSVQVAYTKLDQIKNNLLNTCKTLMKRASEICNMVPGETAVPEELHAVSSVYLGHHVLFSSLFNSIFYNIMCVFFFFKAFSQLPDTLDEIDAMLNEEKTRAECFTGLSDAVR